MQEKENNKSRKTKQKRYGTRKIEIVSTTAKLKQISRCMPEYNLGNFPDN